MLREALVLRQPSGAIGQTAAAGAEKFVVEKFVVEVFHTRTNWNKLLMLQRQQLLRMPNGTKPNILCH